MHVIPTKLVIRYSKFIDYSPHKRSLHITNNSLMKFGVIFILYPMHLDQNENAEEEKIFILHVLR
jgi:hypothetical protein